MKDLEINTMGTISNNNNNNNFLPAGQGTEIEVEIYNFFLFNQRSTKYACPFFLRFISRDPKTDGEITYVLIGYKSATEYLSLAKMLESHSNFETLANHFSSIRTKFRGILKACQDKIGYIPCSTCAVVKDGELFKALASANQVLKQCLHFVCDAATDEKLKKTLTIASIQPYSRTRNSNFKIVGKQHRYFEYYKNKFLSLSDILDTSFPQAVSNINNNGSTQNAYNFFPKNTRASNDQLQQPLAEVPSYLTNIIQSQQDDALTQPSQSAKRRRISSINETQQDCRQLLLGKTTISNISQYMPEPIVYGFFLSPEDLKKHYGDENNTHSNNNNNSISIQSSQNVNPLRDGSKRITINNLLNPENSTNNDNDNNDTNGDRYGFR